MNVLETHRLFIIPSPYYFKYNPCPTVRETVIQIAKIREQMEDSGEGSDSLFIDLGTVTPWITSMKKDLASALARSFGYQFKHLYKDRSSLIQITGDAAYLFLMKAMILYLIEIVRENTNQEWKIAKRHKMSELKWRLKFMSNELMTIVKGLN